MTSIFVAFIKQGGALMAKADKDQKEEKAKRSNQPPKLRFPPKD